MPEIPVEPAAQPTTLSSDHQIASQPGKGVTDADQVEPPDLGATITVDVGDPVAGGECIARHEGRVTFVRDAIPGERVQAQVTNIGKRGSFVRAVTTGIDTASKHRVEPPCALARECGGCDWQHIELGFQRTMKARIIIDALKRTGGITHITDRPVDDVVQVAPLDDGDGLGWRTRMRYAIDTDGHVGLRAARSHRIIPAADCPLATPAISAAVPATVEPSDDGGPSDVGLGNVLIAAESNTGEIVTVDSGSTALLTERVRERAFQVAATGFWQVHPQAPRTLVDTVLEFAEPATGERVLDLYCGVGLFAAFLAEAVGVTGRVDAVESDKTAIRLAKSNLADLGWVHHHRAPVEKWLAAGHRSHADVIVLDPPRSGAGREVITSSTRRRPRAIVYVACDPVSLARDAKYLRDLGYDLTRFRAFDLFPMTKHVESIALFERDRPSTGDSS